MNQSTEVTTISSILLTDRTLSLREHEDVAAVIMTGKCRVVVRKYNATRQEFLCICYANCPWRPPTEFEQEMKTKLNRIVLQWAYYRTIITGTAYCSVFILGVTGMIYVI